MMRTLGRVGVWYSIDRLDEAEIRQLLGRVEDLGYSALWYPEALGYESLSIASFMLANTKKLIIGSSIANIYARDPFTSRRGLRTLSRLYDDRFILGLGVSHVPLVEGVRGHVYEKPVAAMRRYLDGVYDDRRDTAEWPLVIAALGPMMLKLAGERSAGAVPYNVTPEHTRTARAILGPGKLLAVEQKVCLETDATVARGLARHELARYMTLPNYRNNWLRIGFTEADLADGGSDRFLDAMVLWGEPAQIAQGLRAHLEAGADHVCIQPVHADGDVEGRDRTLTALATFQGS
ncbi:putative F420-dependent oxidoreductase [Rhodoligotrophos appendicifer]|uniref:TIGR03620 family F420-dependent LLM class oxidoreductase n=1 Tax=Rhodoligotrophos appendicifer TaxID=987056 RepID=UPI00117D6A3A|nr:TIGR03620 family F420-dependent LLM class oxidoreductase [Rhodoligotrophos appendicifer]